MDSDDDKTSEPSEATEDNWLSRSFSSRKYQISSAPSGYSRKDKLSGAPKKVQISSFSSESLGSEEVIRKGVYPQAYVSQLKKYGFEKKVNIQP
eukprot:UN30166